MPGRRVLKSGGASSVPDEAAAERSEDLLGEFGDGTPAPAAGGAPVDLLGGALGGLTVSFSLCYC